MSDTVAENLTQVLGEIEACRTAALRPAEAVTLVAVSKQQPEARIREALEAGHRVFGENRVQEAAGRWPDLRGDWPGVKLHLIGPLQSNKSADAVALFDVIETLDREKIARTIAAEMEKQDRRPDCLIQVNTGLEPQKAGIAPEDVGDFVAFCREDLGLPLQGLMCIPPLEEEPAMHFAMLADLAEANDLAQLSMGMSGDYQTAIKFGATHVRVGTAVFGARA